MYGVPWLLFISYLWLCYHVTLSLFYNERICISKVIGPDSVLTESDSACYLRLISALCDVDRAYVNLCAQSTVTLHRLIMSSLADIFSFIAIIDIRIVWAYDSMNIIAFYLHSWFISFLYIYCQWFNHSFIMLLSIYMKIHFLEEYLSSFILSKVTIDYNSTCLFVANYIK